MAENGNNRLELSFWISHLVAEDER